MLHEGRGIHMCCMRGGGYTCVAWGEEEGSYTCVA